MSDPRASFLSATDTFVSLVGRLRVEVLGGPGLGGWDLRSLVGHASRSLVTVETYLGQPADRVEVPSAAEYYAWAAEVVRADPAAVDARGREAGAALGADPAGYVRALAERVRGALDGRDGASVLPTLGGAMRLDDYLRTRTFELVVHGLDISAASGVPVEFSPDALADATTLAAEIAVTTGRGPAVLLALTGRTPLAPGFSVV